jgi:hypothetical protein
VTPDPQEFAVSLPGAARYISGLKLVTCRRCTCPGLAWAESTRTGKPYLCHTSRSNRDDTCDLYVAQPWNPHSCDRYRAELDTQTTTAATDRATRLAGIRDMVRIIREARLAGTPAGGRATALALVGCLRRDLAGITTGH